MSKKLPKTCLRNVNFVGKNDNTWLFFLKQVFGKKICNSKGNFPEGQLSRVSATSILVGAVWIDGGEMVQGSDILLHLTAVSGIDSVSSEADKSSTKPRRKLYDCDPAEPSRGQPSILQPSSVS